MLTPDLDRYASASLVFTVVVILEVLCEIMNLEFSFCPASNEV